MYKIDTSISCVYISTTKPDCIIYLRFTRATWQKCFARAYVICEFYTGTDLRDASFLAHHADMSHSILVIQWASVLAFVAVRWICAISRLQGLSRLHWFGVILDVCGCVCQWSLTWLSLRDHIMVEIYLDAIRKNVRGKLETFISHFKLLRIKVDLCSTGRLNCGVCCNIYWTLNIFILIPRTKIAIN